MADLAELRINRTPVSQNSKCESCVHYDGNAAAKAGACEVGQYPQVCGNGGERRYGYAPLSELGPDEIDDLATPCVNGAASIGAMNEYGQIEKTIQMKRVVLGDEDCTIAQRIHGELMGMKKSFGVTQGVVNRFAGVERAHTIDFHTNAPMFAVAKALRDMHFAPRKQRKYDLEAVLDFLLEKGMPVSDTDYAAAGINKSVLDAKARNKIKDKNFALPKQRKYPIEDKAHAVNAEERAAEYASPATEKKIDAAVHRKYPNLGKSTPDVKRVDDPFAKRR